MSNTPLDQFTVAMPHHTHILSSDASPELDWAAAGHPHIWTRAEISVHAGKATEVWIDSGWGILAVVIDGKLVRHAPGSAHEIILPDVVVLDKDYYNTTKYIWR